MIEAQIYYSIQYRWSSMNIGVTATLFVLTLRYHIFVFLSLHAAVKKSSKLAMLSLVCSSFMCALDAVVLRTPGMPLVRPSLILPPAIPRICRMRSSDSPSTYNIGKCASHTLKLSLSPMRNPSLNPVLSGFHRRAHQFQCAFFHLRPSLL